MKNIQIQDSLNQVNTAVEDLQAIQTVIVMAEDHPVYSGDHETLMVVRRALEPIISELKEVFDAIKEEMNNTLEE